MRTHLLIASLLVGSVAFAKIEKSEPLRLQPRAPASAPAVVARPAAGGSAASSGRLNAKAVPFTQKNLGPKGYLKKTQIGGCCVLMGTRLRVEDLNGKAVHDEVIETFETFTLNGLKADTEYNVFVIHPKYPQGLRMDRVRSGNWLNIGRP